MHSSPTYSNFLPMKNTASHYSLLNKRPAYMGIIIIALLGNLAIVATRNDIFDSKCTKEHWRDLLTGFKRSFSAGKDREGERNGQRGKGNIPLPAILGSGTEADRTMLKKCRL